MTSARSAAWVWILATLTGVCGWQGSAAANDFAYPMVREMRDKIDDLTKQRMESCRWGDLAGERQALQATEFYFREYQASPARMRRLQLEIASLDRALAFPTDKRAKFAEARRLSLQRRAMIFGAARDITQQITKLCRESVGEKDIFYLSALMDEQSAAIWAAGGTEEEAVKAIADLRLSVDALGRMVGTADANYVLFLVHYARHCLDHQQWKELQEALVRIRPALDQNSLNEPCRPLVQLMSAGLLVHRGAFQEAQGELYQAIPALMIDKGLSLYRSEAYLLLGKCYYAQENYAAAAVAFEKGTQQNGMEDARNAALLDEAEVALRKLGDENTADSARNRAKYDRLSMERQKSKVR